MQQIKKSSICWAVGTGAFLVVLLGSLSPVAEARIKTKNIIDVYSPPVFDIAVLRNRKPVVVFFASKKCGLCNRILTKLEMKAQDEYSEDLYLARVDMDKFPDLMEQLGVSQTPTVRTYIKGIMTEEVRGLKMPAITQMMERIAEVGKARNRFNQNRFQG